MPRLPDTARHSDPVPRYRFGTATVIDSPSFRLDRYRARRAGGRFEIVADTEVILVAVRTGGVLEHAGIRFELPQRAIALVPPGKTVLNLDSPGEVLGLAPSPGSCAGGSPPFRRLREPGLPVIHAVDAIPVLPHNPRMRILQGEALSINWTEYDGPRDPRRLSPHLHQDFAQGAMVISGQFVHHLRWPWGTDSTLWRSDRHHRAGPGDFIEIPAGVIHTSAGIGSGHHHLIEAFCPPRADFRSKGWIANAADYEPAGGTGSDD